MIEVAYSKLCAKLSGKIVRWIDDSQFIVLCGGREVIGNRQYWSITNEADCD